jgi:acetyl-CoA acetyltransferase
VDEIDDFVASGALDFGGKLPANTAGGLLSEGHLSGFGHVREAVRQIRGECSERQVKDARISMCTGYGGAPHEAPPTVSYSALILGKDG